jgi:competence protein ComEA
VDLIGEERGRLARAAGWLDASPAEAAGLVVLLVGAIAVTVVLAWGALGRPALEVAPGGSAAGGAVGDAATEVGQPGSHGAVDVDAAPSDPHVEVEGHGAHEGAAPAGAAAGDATAQDGEVTVHVTGAVAAPGVITLPVGARVEEAVAEAGGLTGEADTVRVNLARPLVDGEQIVVLREGEDPPPPPDGPIVDGTAAPEAATAPGGTGGRLDVNTADGPALETLPGIGPALAQRIITHREQHGPFREPGDLRDVSGIGEKRFQDLADLVTVG